MRVTGSMSQPSFFDRPQPRKLADIAALVGAEVIDPAKKDLVIRGLASLDEAGPGHLTFFDNLKYVDQLVATQAGACLVSPRFEGRIPARVAVLRARRPFPAFVAIAQAFHPDSLQPRPMYGGHGIDQTAVIHPSVRLEDDVTVDPMAVVGPGVEIGSGTSIGSGAVIGPGVRIGRNCYIGANSTVRAALIGNNVVIHPGCHIGHDGFGYIPGPGGHQKVPQTGRVVIQHNVEIGAGSTIDRGSLRDTMIGEGTKIDNQVQVGHNVYIGRNCLILAQCGLAGSSTFEDNVVLGAKVGVNNHVVVGEGAQVAAMSGIKDSIPPGERWGGIFARPASQWLREMIVVERLARQGAGGGAAHGPKEEGRD